MRFLTLEDCSDGELHCIYHDPERTVTLLHPRTACSLQIYAPEEEHGTYIGTYRSRKPDITHAWWLQLLGLTSSGLLGLANNAINIATTRAPQPDILTPSFELTKHHLTTLRSIIPHNDTLDEAHHLLTIRPLPTPWSFPPHTTYREARHNVLASLFEPLIAELVTHGLLLANDMGIRWAHGDSYILFSTPEPHDPESGRSRIEKCDVRAYRMAVLRRASITEMEEEGDRDERPGTPIVGRGEGRVEGGEKRVRLDAERRCVWIDKEEEERGEGVVEMQEVVDNEGGSEVWFKKLGFGTGGRKPRLRSRICWASESGF
jgi:hypothetical protein